MISFASMIKSPPNSALSPLQSVPRHLRPLSSNWASHASFFQPHLCARHRAERNHDHSRAQRFEFGSMVAQLCHMLAAGQSAEVPQEYEQGFVPAAPHIGQRDPLPINCRQDQVRSSIANAQHRTLPPSAQTAGPGSNQGLRESSISSSLPPNAQAGEARKIRMRASNSSRQSGHMSR